MVSHRKVIKRRGREDRQARAAERLAQHVCTPDCKRFRLGRVEWEPRNA